MKSSTDKLFFGFRCYICLLMLLLPLKFGWQLGVAEQPNYPQGILQWLIFNIWPLQIFCLLSILAFGLSLCISIDKTSATFRMSGKWMLFLPVLTLVAGCFGLVHTTENHYAWTWMENALSVVALAYAVWRMSQIDKKLLPALQWILAISCILACIKGYYQHFVELSANLSAMQDYAASSGLELTDEMLHILSQTRIYGNFTDPNTYAAFLLMTSPFLLLTFWRLGNKVEPAKISRVLLLAVAIFLVVFPLIWSGSRSAVFGVIAALGCFCWHYLFRRWGIIWRCAVCLLLALALGIGLFAMNRSTNRDFSTASIRMEYYASACKMFVQNPLCGVGLGEFFPWHLRLKPAGADESRDAHSQFFMMLAQCGISGGLAAIVRILAPILLLLGFRKTCRNPDNGWYCATIAAWAAWNVHSLFQFDDAVPAMATIIAVIPYFTEFNEKKSASAAAVASAKCLQLYFAAAVVAVSVVICIGQLKAEHGFQKASDILETTEAVADIERARSIITKWADWQPGVTYPWRLLGDAELAAKHYRQAAADYKMLIQAAPHRASSWRRLAQAEKLAGHEKEAEFAKQQAMMWYPTFSKD